MHFLTPYFYHIFIFAIICTFTPTPEQSIYHHYVLLLNDM